MGSEMQARVAAALMKEDPVVIGTLTEHELGELALAAMRAMREPTRAMIDAAYAAHDAYEASDPPAAWCGLSSAFKAMLDAEIKKAEEG